MVNGQRGGAGTDIVYSYAYQERDQQQLPANANTAWKDLLTKYGDKEINYDAIGNPISIGTDWTFTWQNGRELASTTKAGVVSNFKYNESGIRTSKTVTGVTTTYYLNWIALKNVDLKKYCLYAYNLKTKEAVISV